MTNKFNQGVNVDAMLEEMPAGAKRGLLRVLGFRKGRKMAIGRRDLAEEMRKVGFRLHERAIRALINELRKEGHPICSTGGEDGGYWLSENWQELEEYLEREVHSRAMDLLEQEQALRATGEKLWGSLSKQGRLKI